MEHFLKKLPIPACSLLTPKFKNNCQICAQNHFRSKDDGRVRTFRPFIIRSNQTDSDINYHIIAAYPATGILYKINGFLSGHVRMRGKGRGAYPLRYLEMLDTVFGADNNTIEVCSGSVNGCFTVDTNPECNPDLVADGQDLSEIPDNSFDRWRCESPYNEKTAAKMYNTKLPELGKLLTAGARVIKPGSLMFLLCSQNYQWRPPNVKRIGVITMTIVPNNELRACNIYLKLKEAYENHLLTKQHDKLSYPEAADNIILQKERGGKYKDEND
jgi:hypothetical protein